MNEKFTKIQSKLIEFFHLPALFVLTIFHNVCFDFDD